MHLFICLASLLLTFNLSFLRASNYTLQNVQETNISQSISYDDIFENTTSLDAATETVTYKSTELDTTSHVVSSTEVDTVKTLTTFTVLNITSHAQNQTNETSSLPSLNMPNQPVENISVTSLSSSITTEEQLENSTAEYVSTEDKVQNEIVENATLVVQIQTSASKPSTTSIPTTKTKVSTTSIPSTKTKVSTTSIPSTKTKVSTTIIPKTTTKASTTDDFTTSVPPTEVNSATLEYESDKNHDELILSGIFEESHDDYHDDNHLKQTFKNENGNILKTIIPTNNKIMAKFSETAPVPSVVPNNITLFEETAEHNAIHTTDIETATDKTQTIVVGHKCTRIFQESILWNVTDGGMLALKSCPPGYQGNMYRPCFSNGKWGNVDYSECRLEHLGRMRHMIFHQVQKGMLGNMYVLADEFSKYISSVDMKSPMDRLEAFEILNTFLKLDMNLKMDKSRDIKYIQSLLYSCNELIKKKTVLFSPGSQKNKLITEKAVEMIFDLTYFAEKALRGLLKTQKKQIAFRSTSNVVLYLYRGKLSRQFPLMNFSSDYERDDELSSYFNLEKTLERSAYALIWVKGLHDLLSMDNLLVNSDVAVATILSPLNSLNHLLHPPTFDIGLRIRKEVPEGYTLKCGQLWNMSQSAKLTEYLDIPTGRWFNTRSTQNLWNTEDCIKASRKGDIVTCRCHHLGSISLLLEEEPQATSGPSPPVGKLITVSCVTSLSATVLTLVINFLLKRRDQSLSIFILINLLVCLASIQITFMLGINKTDHFEVCLSFAVLLHYLFLVSCFWVVSYSIYLLQRLRSCMEYVGRIRDYCAFCWMLPTLLLIISFVVNPNGYETKQFCWLNVQRGILWSFVIPVTGLILVNTIVMILALKTFNEQMSVTHRVEICKTRNSMRAGITLLPFFAINWFFGILAVEDPENMSLQVIFALTNSMQGILTFVFFCVMDNNVQMLFRLKFHEASRKPKVSAMRLKKSGSFPILERPLITLTDDNRRNDCTPLLSQRTNYSETSEDPCCSNIRV